MTLQYTITDDTTGQYTKLIISFWGVKCDHIFFCSCEGGGAGQPWAPRNDLWSLLIRRKTSKPREPSLRHSLCIQAYANLSPGGFAVGHSADHRRRRRSFCRAHYGSAPPPSSWFAGLWLFSGYFLILLRSLITLRRRTLKNTNLYFTGKTTN